MQTLADLIARQPRSGRVEWIGLRPERLVPMRQAERAHLAASGLKGDHARPGKRALTLLQAEHLPVIAALSGHARIDPASLRRNLLISGINLVSLREATLSIGTARIFITGPCAPCSRMEAALGPGGYNAMRGHGGWCAEVLDEGEIKLGDAVIPG